MPVHDASVLHLRRVSEVEHRPVEPPIGSLAESQLGIGSDALPASPASREIVSKLAGREDPTLNGPPAKPTVFVFEADLEDPGRAAVYGARRGAGDESAIVPAPDADHRRRPSTPPDVQVRPAEEQLATGAWLLGRDRSLSGQATKAVAVDSEVLGGTTRVEPIVVGGLLPRETVDDLRGDDFG